MKFWTTIPLRELPVVFGSGLDDRYSEGFQVYNDPEALADTFYQSKADWEEKGELEETPEEHEDQFNPDEDYRYTAFLTFEIPDDEIDDWLVICMAHSSDVQSDIEGELEDAIENEAPQDEIDALAQSAAILQDMDSGAKSLSFFGHACLGRVIEPYMLSLIDPTTMTEALYTGERVQVETALWDGEATSLLSLSPSFWVWIMMLLGQIISGDAQETQTTEERDTAAASRKAAARRARRRQSGRGKKKKKKKTTKRSGSGKGIVTA